MIGGGLWMRGDGFFENKKLPFFYVFENGGEGKEKRRERGDEGL